MYSGAASGLWTSPNPFAAIPSGSLAKADNVVWTAPNVLEPRRGLSILANSTFGVGGNRADAIEYYNGKIVIHYDSDKIAIKAGAGVFAVLTGPYPFESPSSNRIRFVNTSRSLFFNTRQGLFVYDGVGNPTFAGNPVGLSIAATNAPDNGWMLPDTAVAYRYTICSKDAFGRVIEGPPSGRTSIRNEIFYDANGFIRASNVVYGTFYHPNGQPSGWQVGDTINITPGDVAIPPGPKVLLTVNDTNPLFTDITYAEAGIDVSSTVPEYASSTRSTTVTCTFPTDTDGNPVTTNNFLRVYRSQMTETAASTPSDNLRQCYESAYLTATDITNGFLTLEDIAPESVLDVDLYTNSNRDTGLQANYQPPKANDIAMFGNRMWFANTESKHSLSITLVGCGAPEGLQDGDTITFRPNDGSPDAIFTGVAYPSVIVNPNYQFQIFTDGDPGFNIQRTAHALVECINRSSYAQNANLYAFYTSSETGNPGQILIQAREFGDSHGFKFYFNGYPNAWTPQPPDLFTGLWVAPASDNNRHAAGLWYSKLSQPEAVPPVNYLQVESDNDPILRIFPLQYRLLVFKTSGIYYVTDSFPFALQKMSDYKLRAPDSIALLDDRAYCLTDQGIIAIGDSGVTPISIPIDDTITELGGPTSLANLQTFTVGCAYRSARQYLCSTIAPVEDSDDYTAYNDQTFVYSTLSGGFTRYTLGFNAAVVDPSSDKLVVCPSDGNQLWVENKTLTDADYTDLSAATTLASISGNVLGLGSVLGIELGAVIEYNTEGFIITAIDLDANTVTTLGAPGNTWTPSIGVTIRSPIRCDVVFNKMTGGDPGTMKMAEQCSYLFRSNTVYEPSYYFYSEININEQHVPIANDVYGETPWGESAYGDPVRQIRRVPPLPIDAANSCQLTVGFYTQQALAKWEFLGISIVMKNDTTANRG